MRLGLDIGGSKIEAAVLGPDGRVLARRRAATPADYAGKLKTAAALADAVEAEAGARGLPAGVGHPGSANPKTGRIRNANSSDLNGRDLARDLAAALRRKVRLANDADCFALSEATDGAGAGAACVFGVILGTGVGGGVVIGGRVHGGAFGAAGEWGHNPLPRPGLEEIPGPACQCGRAGCIEAWLSGPALAADYHRAGGAALDAHGVAARAAEGDARAQDALARYVDRLGRALATVANLLDPDVIVLGGGVSNLDGLAARAEAAMRPHQFTDAPQTPVRRNRHGDSSGVRGAAWLWPVAGVEEGSR